MFSHKLVNIFLNSIAVQGLGAGGMASLCHIILSDLVPLEERGVFNGLIAMYVIRSNVRVS